MKAFTEYDEAYQYARDIATTLRRDVGIEKAWEFSSYVFRVGLLPDKDNRSGWELRCEVVHPNQP
jgi:hypothetical protein